MEQDEKIIKLNYYAQKAKEYNKWARGAKRNLLVNLSPKVYNLGIKGYTGCGFHYGMEQRLGNLICKLVFRWEPDINHFDALGDEFAESIVTRILYENLVEDIEKAENENNS